MVPFRGRAAACTAADDYSAWTFIRLDDVEAALKGARQHPDSLYREWAAWARGRMTAPATADDGKISP